MPDQPSDNRADYPVVISLPVQWGDQDLFGHVNNVVYFRWYESARIAYLDRIGVSDLMERRAPRADSGRDRLQFSPATQLSRRG